MGYAAWSVVAGEQPTASKWNILGTNDSSFNDGTGLGAGAVGTSAIAANAVGVVRLNAIEGSDLFSGTAITPSTWTDFKTNQNFTVDNANSTIVIFAFGQAALGNGSSGGSVASRAVVDSAGTPIYRYLGGQYHVSATDSSNCFAGACVGIITGLSAGTHTIKTQIWTNCTGSPTLYCRPSTQPDQEFFSTVVVELKK